MKAPTQLQQPGRLPGNVVFLHTNSGCATDFKTLFDHDLSQRNLWSFDLPGHGGLARSSEPEGSFSVEEHLQSLTDHISPLTGDVLLVGISFGGHLAMEILPRLEKVKGVIISGSPPLRKPPNFAEAYLEVPGIDAFFRREVNGHELHDLFGRLMPQSDEIEPMRKQFQATVPRVRPSIAEDLNRGAFGDEVDYLRWFTGPKVFIHPNDDPVPNMAYVSGLDAGLQIAEIPHGGHFPHLDCPEEVARIVAQVANDTFSRSPKNG